MVRTSSLTWKSARELPETVIIKEIQRHPVEKQTLVHADFVRISLDEPVSSPVPVVLTGTPPGVQQGGVLELQLRQLTLHCLPTQLPKRGAG